MHDKVTISSSLGFYKILPYVTHNVNNGPVAYVSQHNVGTILDMKMNLVGKYICSGCLLEACKQECQQRGHCPWDETVFSLCCFKMAGNLFPPTTADEVIELYLFPRA